MSAVPARRAIARDGPESRPCSHDPVAQVSAAAVRARPASVGPSPRSRESSSGRKTSAPKNAAALSPRSAITAGRPGRAVTVPAGSSRGTDTTSATSAATPTTVPVRPPTCPASCRPAAPAAAPAAHPIRRAHPPRGCPAGCGSTGSPSPRNAGSTSNAAGTASAAASRNTQRQSRCSTISPASGGPTTDGSTHAAANAAKIRGRRSGGTHRPTTT